MPGYLYFARYWPTCIAIVCKPGYDVMNFEVNLIFLIKLFFLSDINILRTERAFKMKKKAFFFIFVGLSIKQIAQIFLECGSLSLNYNIYLIKKFKNLY